MLVTLSGTDRPAFPSRLASHDSTGHSTISEYTENGLGYPINAITNDLYISLSNRRWLHSSGESCWEEVVRDMGVLSMLGKHA